MYTVKDVCGSKWECTEKRKLYCKCNHWLIPVERMWVTNFDVYFSPLSASIKHKQTQHILS